MLNVITAKRLSALTLQSRYGFGLGNLILHYIRTVMNRVRWEENRQLRSLQTRGSNVPRSTEQANKLFVASQQALSLSEEARMQRIDQLLGTHTHHTTPKPYQQRLDSDHIMDLEQLKKLHPEQDRAILAWLNPKSDIKLRYRNRRKYYSFLSQLRTYPRHEASSYSFNDQTNENTISFLAKETLYSNISLKPVELTAESMQAEPCGPAEKGWFQSHRFVYFRPQEALALLRVPKEVFKSPEAALKEGHAEVVISLDDIYQTLKQYDTDERVSEYLKKAQNGRLEYLFSFMSVDRAEGTVAVMIDLLGTKKEYCLLVKSLAHPTAQLIPIFNVRPQAVFSANGQHICYVQRSPQGGWIQLAYRSVQSCWSRSKEVVEAQQLLEDELDGQVVFRCEVEKELRLGTDSNRGYIFLAVRNYQQEFTESLHLVDHREGGVSLIELDRGQRCRYAFDVSPIGIVLTRFHQADSFLKFGGNTSFAQSIQLIPYKQHIQLHSSQRMGINDGLLPISQRQMEVVSPTEFDVAAKRTIFIAGQNEFIQAVEVRESHLVAVLNIHSVYDRAILYFLPFKESAHPHSLLLGGGARLQLRSHNHAYHSQLVEFTRPYGCLSIQKTYNIWKRELADAGEERARFHFETVTINEEESPIEVTLLCRSLYADQKNLPVLIYFPTRNEEIQGAPLRQFLEKGAMVVEFKGRGTFSRDLEHFLRGSRHNFPRMLDDLQAVIEFVGNNLTKNISLYCKGEVSSLVGLWFNVYFPFLFNTTILHNGIYDLTDAQTMERLSDFFGKLNEEEKAKWDNFNIFKHGFKQPVPSSTRNGLEIGTLEHIILSSDKNHRFHSRRLVHRLRENQNFRYEEVYLKEYDNEVDSDLFNLSYVYSRMRSRMEQEINTPEEQLDEEEQKQEMEGAETSEMSKQDAENGSKQ